jgi:hypothetical protein
LEVWIQEARNLPNMDMLSEKFRQGLIIRQRHEAALKLR